MAQVIRTLDYLSFISERRIMDHILRQFESIEAFEFFADPHMAGYIMRVQTKDPDFRWVVEDF